MKHIYQISLLLMTLNMINAEEHDVLAIIKLDDRTKYIEICTNGKEWYVRAVNNEDIMKVSLASDRDKAVGSAIMSLLEKNRSNGLGNAYPRALVFDSRPGNDPMYDVDSENMSKIIDRVDLELTKIKSMTISELKKR